MTVRLGTVVLACAALGVGGATGCVTRQLRAHVTEQAASLPDVYYQEVLDNLAMVAAEPSRMPYFSDPQTARAVVQRSASGRVLTYLDLVETAPTGVLRLFDRRLFDRQSAAVTGAGGVSGEWSAMTANDPDKLFTMRAAYRRVVGTATAEDEEILREFYYRHFEVTDSSLAALRRSAPEAYAAVGARLGKVKGIEYLSVDAFESRLARDDVLGRDDLDRYRRAILRTSRMEREPGEFVSDADTHHLLYVRALRPGWVRTGPERAVPRGARYVGRYRGTAV